MQNYLPVEQINNPIVHTYTPIEFYVRQAVVFG